MAADYQDPKVNVDVNHDEATWSRKSASSSDKSPCRLFVDADHMGLITVADKYTTSDSRKARPLEDAGNEQVVLTRDEATWLALVLNDAVKFMNDQDARRTGR